MIFVVRNAAYFVLFTLFIALFDASGVSDIQKIPTRFPPIKLECLTPTGFRIVIPHESYIDIIGFDITVNGQEIMPEISNIFPEPINGLWIFENKVIPNVHNAIIYYKIYLKDDQENVSLKEGTVIVTETYMDIWNPNITSDPGKLPSGCVQSLTTVGGKPVCKGELIFEDTFDKIIINWTKWRREVRLPLDTEDAEFVIYEGDGSADMFHGSLDINLNSRAPFDGKFDLGQLCTGTTDPEKECIRYAWSPQTIPSLSTTKIRTKHFFSFRYGRVEVRAKLPIGDWIIPLILLEPLENYYGQSGFASGQIRVVSALGNLRLVDKFGENISGSLIRGGVILAAGEKYRKLGLKGTQLPEHAGNEYHIYSMTWTDRNMTFSIDNQIYGFLGGNFVRILRNEKPYAKYWDNGNTMAPFDREFYLSLGMSVGGHSDFPDGCLNGAAEDANKWTNKPWNNTDPRAIRTFRNDAGRWFKTWLGRDYLSIDYIRVYAL